MTLYGAECMAQSERQALRGAERRSNPGARTFGRHDCLGLGKNGSPRAIALVMT